MTRRTQTQALQEIRDIISTAEPKAKTREMEIIEWNYVDTEIILHIAVRLDDDKEVLTDELFLGLEAHNHSDCGNTIFLEAKRDWGRESLDTTLLFFQARLNIREEGEI